MKHPHFILGGLKKMEIRQRTMNTAMETFFPLWAKILRYAIAKLP